MSTETKATHTPLPWRQHPKDPVCVYGELGPDDEGEYDGFVCNASDHGKSTECDLGNAALIVRAVNNHEALVVALKDMETTFLALAHGAPLNRIKHALEQVRAAIAKAEGRS